MIRMKNWRNHYFNINEIQWTNELKQNKNWTSNQTLGTVANISIISFNECNAERGWVVEWPGEKINGIDRSLLPNNYYRPTPMWIRVIHLITMVCTCTNHQCIENEMNSRICSTNFSMVSLLITAYVTICNLAHIVHIVELKVHRNSNGKIIFRPEQKCLFFQCKIENIAAHWLRRKPKFIEIPKQKWLTDVIIAAKFSMHLIWHVIHGNESTLFFIFFLWFPLGFRTQNFYFFSFVQHFFISSRIQSIAIHFYFA